MTGPRKLYRSRDDRVIAGVCGGIAEYFGVDPVFVRVIALLLLIVGNGATFIVYLVMAVVVPEKPKGDASATSAAQTVGPTAPAPAERYTPEVARRAGLTGGFVLVALGLVFLVARFLPGIAWWSMWPSIIIFVGIVQCVTPARDGWDAERFFGGLVTIAAGLVLLGNATGYVSWRAWWVLLSLWPVLLISIGLNVMGKGLRQVWLRALGSLVILVAFGYVASVSWTGAGGLPYTGAWIVGSGGEPYAFSEPATPVSSARLKLEGGVGDIRVSAGTDLVRVTGETLFGKPGFSATTSGDTADVRVTAAGHGPAIVAPGVAGPHMDIALGDTPVWDLDMTMGASSLTADLSAVHLSGLKLSTGVSSSSVKLGPVPYSKRLVPVLVKSGVASVELLVPKGERARVYVAGGLTGTDLGSSFDKAGDHWEKPGYSSASGGYDIHVQSGVGSVSVQTY